MQRANDRHTGDVGRRSDAISMDAISMDAISMAVGLWREAPLAVGAVSGVYSVIQGCSTLEVVFAKEPPGS